MLKDTLPLGWEPTSGTKLCLRCRLPVAKYRNPKQSFDHSMRTAMIAERPLRYIP
jgi:hypothetical protein